MKSTATGAVIGLVLGVAIGASVVAPGLKGDGPDAPLHPRPLGQALSSLANKKTDIAPADENETKAKDVIRMAALSATKTETVEQNPAPEKQETSPAPAPIPGPLTISFKLETAFPPSDPVATAQMRRLIGEIKRLSQGSVAITPFGPDAIVPPEDLLKAVASSTVDAAFSSPHLWAGRIPLFGLLSAVPFGPEPLEHIRWFFTSEAKNAYDAAYRDIGVKGLICGVSAPSGAAAWFHEEITDPGQLQDKRVRLTGPGARVLKRLGVMTVDMAVNEALSALEAGELDGAMFTGPDADKALGVHRVAKHYYFPAWDRPTHLYELIINLKTWRALGPGRQAHIEAACGDNIRHGLAASAADTEVGALMSLGTEGVQVHRWPANVLKAIEGAWLKELEDAIENDETARTLWQSLGAFRENYAIWRELTQGPPLREGD